MAFSAVLEDIRRPRGKGLSPPPPPPPGGVTGPLDTPLPRGDTCADRALAAPSQVQRCDGEETAKVSRTLGSRDIVRRPPGLPSLREIVGTERRAVDPKETNSGKKVPVILQEPENTPSFYATNLVVQHTKYEFIISFFEVRPPLLWGPPEEKEKMLEEIDAIRSSCSARIVVAADRMPSFVQVLQDNLKTFLASKDVVETDE